MISGFEKHIPRISAWRWCDGDDAVEEESPSEALLAEWAESSITPGQIRSMSTLAESFAYGGDDPEACEMLLTQLAGRGGELTALEDACILVEETLSNASTHRSHAEDLINGEQILGEKPRSPEEMLPCARYACERAHATLAALCRFLAPTGSSTYVDTAVMLITNGKEIGDAGLDDIGLLVERFGEIENDLRKRYEQLLDHHGERAKRVAKVLGAIDVVGVEQVASRIADHFGLRRQALVLAEECCELGHAAARAARDEDEGGITRKTRAELLEEAADVFLVAKQVLMLAGIDSGEVKEAMRKKVARTIVCKNVPLSSDEEGSAR